MVSHPKGGIWHYAISRPSDAKPCHIRKPGFTKSGAPVPETDGRRLGAPQIQSAQQRIFVTSFAVASGERGGVLAPAALTQKTRPRAPSVQNEETATWHNV